LIRRKISDGAREKRAHKTDRQWGPKGAHGSGGKKGNILSKGQRKKVCGDPERGNGGSG